MATEFDQAQLSAVTGGDAEFERELLEEYLGSAGADLARLAEAVHGNDAKAAGQLAHAIKGASATIGAKGFAAIALDIERAGKSGDLSSAPSRLEAMRTEFEALSTYLRDRISKAA